MKKVVLVLGSLLLVEALSYAKEAPVTPVEVSKEVVVAPVIVEEELLVEYAPVYNIYGKIGVDIWSEYDEWKYGDDYGSYKFNKKDTKNLGFEVALEGTRNITDNFELGLGIAYQNHTNPKSRTETNSYSDDFIEAFYKEETKMPKFDSVPLYAVGKYNFKTDSVWKPYLKATVGYSFNIKDKDAKEFYSSTNSYAGETHEYSSTYKYKTDIKNGFYYGVGAGIEYENFFADLMYQVNQAKVKLTEEYDGEKYELGKNDFNYSRVTLGFGYKFNL